MKRDDLIYVAGHRGMVGASIVRALTRAGFTNLVTRSHAELPLDDQAATRAFFEQVRPTYVLLGAARVGGIAANLRYGGDFIRDNLLIQTNVIDAAYRAGTRKLLFLASSCIYPKHATQPIAESSLLTGPLEPTNQPYAIAKIAGIEMCDAYRRQFGFDAISVMPSNIYGIGDNFDPQSSHVVAGMMRRVHEAKVAGAESVTLWGTGKPMRELTYCDDLAEACIFLMKNFSDEGAINVGSGEELSIRSLAEMIAKVVGYDGELRWDTRMPDGTPRKVMDHSRIRALGWRPGVPLAEGLRRTYEWWLANSLERLDDALDVG
jgi:GDP-L-fucose synthase